MAEVLITIPKTGKTQIEVKGSPGKSCLDVTRGIEEALGGKETSRKDTKEMRMRNNATKRTRNTNTA